MEVISQEAIATMKQALQLEKASMMESTEKKLADKDAEMAEFMQTAEEWNNDLTSQVAAKNAELEALHEKYRGWRAPSGLDHVRTPPPPPSTSCILRLHRN